MSTMDQVEDTASEGRNATSPFFYEVLRDFINGALKSDDGESSSSPSIHVGSPEMVKQKREIMRPGGGSAMPLPRASTGSFVQYLDPSEPESRARLDSSALLARKAAPAVSARFAAQGWAWRDVRRSATKRAHSDIV